MRDYELSREYLKNSFLDTAHIFSYSDRPYTSSKNLFPKVVKREIERRSKELRMISKEKYEKFYGENIGKRKEIIIEKIKKVENEFIYSGITDNYLQINFVSKEKYGKGNLVTIIL